MILWFFYRPSVKEILEKSKKKKSKHEFKMNTGLDYYPFPR